MPREDGGGRKESTGKGLIHFDLCPHWQARKFGASFHEFCCDKGFTFLTLSLYTVSLGRLIILPPSPWLQVPVGR